MRRLPASLLLLAAGCGAAPPVGGEDPVSAEWSAFRERRARSLAGEDGWLTLIGLHWLEEGETRLGSEPGSGIVLPADRAPARVGRLVVEGGAARFVPEPAVPIVSAGEVVGRELALAPDDPGPPTILELGSLRMHVIARSGRLALRVKDRESPARRAFAGVPCFDYDPRFRVAARFEPAPEGAVLPIVNVLGMQADEPLAGTLRLAVDGRPLALLATYAGRAPEDGLTVMFRDATSELDPPLGTYPAGRYLEVAQPSAAGEAIVDFNFAYTPPCGYTEFATCPLPPPENEIALEVRAGERYEGH